MTYFCMSQDQRLRRALVHACHNAGIPPDIRHGGSTHLKVYAPGDRLVTVVAGSPRDMDITIRRAVRAIIKSRAPP